MTRGLQTRDAHFAPFDLALRDGLAEYNRSMHASDEAEFLQAFERLSPDARCMRVVGERNVERWRETSRC